MQGRDHPRRPSRRFVPQPHHPRRGRARVYIEETDGYRIERRRCSGPPTTQPHVHLRPRPLQELRGFGPGAGSTGPETDAATDFYRTPDQHSDQKVRRAQRSPIGLDGQRSESNNHISKPRDRQRPLRRGHPGFPPTAAGRSQPHLLEQPRPLPRTRVEILVPTTDRNRDHLRRHERRRPRQLDFDNGATAPSWPVPRRVHQPRRRGLPDLLPRRAANGSRPRATTSTSTTAWARRRGFEFPKPDQFGSGTPRPAPMRTAPTSGGTSGPATRATAGSRTRTDGTEASVTGPAAGRAAGHLPSDCASSVGPANREAPTWWMARPDLRPPACCDWWTPSPPQSGRRARGVARRGRWEGRGGRALGESANPAEGRQRRLRRAAARGPLASRRDQPGKRRSSRPWGGPVARARPPARSCRHWRGTEEERYATIADIRASSPCRPPRRRLRPPRRGGLQSSREFADATPTHRLYKITPAQASRR